MKAMALTRPAARVVDAVDLPVPIPGRGEVLVRVRACGVCRTALHVVDGELPDPKMPIVPGHEIVGTVERVGEDVSGRNDGNDLAVGDRVGIPWLGYSCGVCQYCRSGRENLCPNARFTGYQIDGGYAEYAVADARYAFPVPDAYGDIEAAPLLCAGLIGDRSYRIAGGVRRPPGGPPPPAGGWAGARGGGRPPPPGGPRRARPGPGFLPGRGGGGV